MVHMLYMVVTWTTEEVSAAATVVFVGSRGRASRVAFARGANMAARVMVAALGRARTLSGKDMKRARARSVDLGQAPQKPRMPLWPVYDPDLSRPRQLQKIAWELLEDPSASKASKAISLFIMGVIVLSVFSFLLAAEFAPPCDCDPPWPFCTLP